MENSLSGDDPLKPIPTGDGSYTLMYPGTAESYHSVFGAVSESMHIFIEAGFLAVAAVGFCPLNIFEVGLGTGLNALLTRDIALQKDLAVHYDAAEPFPLPASIAGKLGHHRFCHSAGAEADFKNILRAGESGHQAALSGKFVFRSFRQDFRTLALPPSFYHCIYFDAFSPGVAPQMWETAGFAQLFDSLHTGGLLLTYCAKGAVRRSLLEAGFQVERMPGPPGKREILRARKVLT
jgi:tRNA U34 5-methylaminomethyl-2-thiouridine-forming methyltransferase MnmC